MVNAPRVLAHRGASGYAVENSRAAFREALRLGAQGVELDIHVAATGELVVYHDFELPGLGPIASLDWETIRSFRLPNGETIPTLGEALDVTLEGTGAGEREVWIEIKALPEPADTELFRTIDSCPVPGACAVHSFDHRIVARLGRKRPSLRRGVLSASYPVNPVEPLRAAGASALWQEWHLIDADLVQAIHRENARIIAWTVNDSDLARRLAGLGVDALCGNWPDRLRT